MVNVPRKGTGFDLENLDISSADRTILRDFLRAWDEHGGPVLFVGAGMSRHQADRRADAPATSTLRDWSELTGDLRRELVGDNPGLDGALPSDYLRLAQLHETYFHRVRLLDAVERALPTHDFEPGLAHRRLRNFPWKAVVTTNYDDLLERTFLPKRPILKIVWDVDLTRRRTVDTLLLVKMHGELGDRNSIVLTEDDYRCYERDRPGVALKVKQLLLEHPTLFLGFSLSDPNVAAIEGWIRDTIGQVQLPSVALVHGNPLPAEEEMWARRGIRLVHLPLQEPMARFLDALAGERGGGTCEKVREETGTSAAAQAELNLLFAKRDSNSLKQVADFLNRSAASSNKREIYDVAREVLWGQVRKIKKSEMQAILDQLTPSSRRRIFLIAYERGTTMATAIDGKVVDIEQELLSNTTLSPTETAEVCMRYAQRLEYQGDLEQAKNELLRARDLELDRQTREQVILRLRKVLLRIGDQSLISKELLDVPLPEDTFSYARRGADTLVSRGREAARPWYEKARDLARTGDEKYSALLGLAATCELDDWSRSREIEEDRLAILPEDRPRAEQIFGLREKAAGHLLEAFRDKPKLEHEPEWAVSKLRQAMDQADDMGWPHGFSHNYISISDGLARDIVGLLLRDDTSWRELKEGLCTIVERGLLKVNGFATFELAEKILSQPGGAVWLRNFLSEATDAVHMKRVRQLLRSAFAIVLPDDELTAHIESWLSRGEQTSKFIRETTTAEAHGALLQPHFGALPRAAVQHVLQVAGSALRSGNFGNPRDDLLELPIDFWLKTGSASATDHTVQALVHCIAEVWSPDRLVTDWVWRRSLLGLLHNLVNAGVLLETDKLLFTEKVDESLVLAQEVNDKTIHMLDLAAARFALGIWVPPEAIRDWAVSAYGEMRNSSAAGQWMDLVGYVGTYFTPEQKSLLATNILDYADSALREADEKTGSIHSNWTAAKGVHNAIKHGIVEPEVGHQTLLELVKMRPNCAAWALNLPGPNQAMVAAEDILVSATARCEDTGLGLLTWCDWIEEGTAVSRWLEEVLLARLFASNPLYRQKAYWSLMHLGRKKALSESTLARLKESVFRFGRIDSASRPRAAAVTAASRIRDVFSDDEILLIQSDAQADPVAWVRRAADVLALNSKQESGQCNPTENKD